VRVVEQRMRLGDISVAEAMSDGIVSLPRSAPMSEVARLMAEERIHCVVIEDLPEHDSPPLWGVVSALDLVAAATVRELEDQTAAGSAATAVLTVCSDDTLLRAGQLMTEHATAHLVVVDPHTGHPVGVISTLDVTAALAGIPAEAEPCSA
jgi:CBS domain-containing protein